MSYQVADVRSRSIGFEAGAMVRSYCDSAPSGFDITMIVLLLLLVAIAVIILLVLAFRKSNANNNGTLTFSYIKVNPINPTTGVYSISYSAPAASKVSISPTTYLNTPTAASNLPATGTIDLSGVTSTKTYTLTAVDASGNTIKKTVRVIHGLQ